MLLPVQMCPHCGYNLYREKPLCAGRFSYFPEHGFYIDYRRFRPGGPMLHEILGSIMAARGRPVSKLVLSERCGSQGADTDGGSIKAMLSQARASFHALNIAVPFEPVYGRGYAWVGPTVHEIYPQANQAA